MFSPNCLPQLSLCEPEAIVSTDYKGDFVAGGISSYKPWTKCPDGNLQLTLVC